MNYKLQMYCSIVAYCPINVLLFVRYRKTDQKALTIGLLVVLHTGKLEAYILYQYKKKLNFFYYFFIKHTSQHTSRSSSMGISVIRCVRVRGIGECERGEEKRGVGERGGGRKN